LDKMEPSSLSPSALVPGANLRGLDLVPKIRATSTLGPHTQVFAAHDRKED
jgi:hypothetical protein